MARARGTRIAALLIVGVATSGSLSPLAANDVEIPPEVAAFEQRVISVVEKTRDAFVCVGGGSGVIISADGWVVTNHHVTGDTKKFTLRRPNGHRHEATVRGFDSEGDIALLKIEDWLGPPLPHVELGDSDALIPGQWVVALGNPWGFAEESAEPSVSLGVVSAIHRFQGGYGDAIQTDAALNPGNSGGPLLDLDGRLIGINGRIAARFRERRNSGVGYAISAVQIRRFLAQLQRGGRVLHGSITGVVVEDRPAIDSAPHPPTGVVVRKVSEDSPAWAAGLRPGDEILETAGYPVPNVLRWQGIVSTFPRGNEIDLLVSRPGADQDTASSRLTLKVALSEPTPSDELTPGGNLPPAPGTPFVGLDLGASTLTGVMVSGVYEGSPADRAGIRPGDVVSHWNDTEAVDRFQLETLLSGGRFGDRVRIRLERGQEARDITVKIENASGYQGAKLKTRPTPQPTPPGQPAPPSPELPAGPRPTPEALGLVLGDLDAQGQGIVVEEVLADKPAAAAGFETGDVIVKFAGSRPMDFFDLDERIRKAAPGTTVNVEVMRSGSRHSLKLSIPTGTPEEREDKR